MASPEPNELQRYEPLFASAEQRTALLERCPAQLAPSVRARCLAALERGGAVDLPPPRPAGVALGAVRARLEQARAELQRLGRVGALYAARAAELELEARLVEAIGTPAFAVLARRRFPAPREHASELLGWARQAASAGLPAPAEPLFRSDDLRSPSSLASQLERAIAALRVAVRVVVRPDLTSHAATGDGVIYVKAGVWHSARRAARITRHELMGHALPRVRARAEPLGLFRVGAAGSSDDEEGRALLIESRDGSMDAERRRELALRHLTALAVANGGSATDVARELQGYGASAAAALDLYLRAARGGGLCRELVYLPAWRRAEAIFERDPELERWLERGRLSFEAAVVLRAAEGARPAPP